MPVVRELLTRWGFDVDDKAVDRFNSKLESAKKVAKVATTAILAAGAAAGALVAQLTASGDKIAKVSRQLGISTDDYQKLAYAAGLGGSSQEELVGSLRVLSRTMDEAHSKAGEQRKSFEELGISVTDASGKMRPTVDVLMDIADNFKSTEGGAQKTAAALKLFGRGGMSMVTALEGGSDGLREMMREADALGIVMDQRLLLRTEAMNDEMDRLKAVGKSVGIMIGSELLPYVLRAAQAFVGWYKSNREFIAVKIKEWMEALSGAASSLWDWLKKVWKVVDDVVQGLGGWQTVMDGAIFLVKTLLTYKLVQFFGDAMSASAKFAVGFLTDMSKAVIATSGLIGILAVAISMIPKLEETGYDLGYNIHKFLFDVQESVRPENGVQFIEEPMTPEQMKDAKEWRFGGGREQHQKKTEEKKKKTAERQKWEGATIEVGEPEIAVKKIKVSAEELINLTGWKPPSTREFARLGSQGQLVTGPIDIGNNITIQLPVGATLQDAEQVKKFVAPVVRQELQRAARELQADLEAQ